MKTALTLAIVVAFFGTALTVSFTQSLPTWCAHPEGSGNWIVHSLNMCKGI